jgi:hypothetical protein
MDPPARNTGNAVDELVTQVWLHGQRLMLPSAVCLYLAGGRFQNILPATSRRARKWHCGASVRIIGALCVFVKMKMLTMFSSAPIRGLKRHGIPASLLLKRWFLSHATCPEIKSAILTGLETWRNSSEFPKQRGNIVASLPPLPISQNWVGRSAQWFSVLFLGEYPRRLLSLPKKRVTRVTSGQLA